MTKVPSHMIVRNGVFAYKRRVPPELKNRSEFAGKSVFQVSLGVRTVADARRKAQAMGLDDLFSSVPPVRVERETGTVLTTPLLRQIADENYRRGLEAQLRSRSTRADGDGEAERDELAAQDIGSLNNRHTAARTRSIIRRELTPALEAQAIGIAARIGITPNDEAIESIVGALFESELALTGARVELAEGHAFPEWSPGGIKGAKAETAPTDREAHWTFKRLAQAATRQHPKGDSWEHKVTTVAALFDEYVGSAPIYKIDAKKIRGFVNEIQFMPVAMTQRFPGLSLKEAIEANEALDKPYKVISPNTARDGYFSILRWCFGHAVEIGAIPANPCTGIKIRGATKATGKRTRNPFTIDELNAFFQLPVFTGCLSEKRPNSPGSFTFADHRKWAPLLMLFTGARTSEIAQLAVSDIKGDAAHPYISILTEYDADDPDEERDFVLSHKTENARRDVPLHPTLIDLGFLRYVAERKDAGDVRLFPDWKASKDGRKLYSSAPWIRNVNDKQIPEITNRRPKPTLYSFRHTWKTQMATCHVPPQYQNQMLGHAQQGMDDHYLGRLDIVHTYKAVKGVIFEGLVLSHLKTY